MAHFRGTIRGNRGEVSRLGTDNLRACLDGWNIGVNVDLIKSILAGRQDLIKVRLTGGSNNNMNRENLSYALILDIPDNAVFQLNGRNYKVLGNGGIELI
jgi:hypothetical protein